MKFTFEIVHGKSILGETLSITIQQENNLAAWRTLVIHLDNDLGILKDVRSITRV